MSEEQKEKLRAKALVQWSNLEALTHISAMRKGRAVSESTKDKLRDETTQRWTDPIYKARLVESLKAAQQLIAADHSKTMKQKWADPIYREMMMAARLKSKLEKLVTA